MELLRRPAILTGSSRSWLVEPCTCTAASTADAHVTTEWKRRRRASSPSIISSTRATSLLANASALKAHHRNSLLSNQITVLNPSSDCQCLPNLVTKLTHSKRNHRRPSDYAGTAKSPPTLAVHLDNSGTTMRRKPELRKTCNQNNHATSKLIQNHRQPDRGNFSLRY